MAHEQDVTYAMVTGPVAINMKLHHVLYAGVGVINLDNNNGTTALSNCMSKEGQLPQTSVTDRKLVA